MSEPTTEKMLGWMDDYRESYDSLILPDDEKMFDALRRLIEERGKREKKIRRFRRRAMVLKEAADETGVWIENIEKFLGDVIREFGKVG